MLLGLIQMWWILKYKKASKVRCIYLQWYELLLHVMGWQDFSTSVLNAQKMGQVILQFLVSSSISSVNRIHLSVFTGLMHGVGTSSMSEATGTAEKWEWAAAPSNHPRTSRTRATRTEVQATLPRNEGILWIGTMRSTSVCQVMLTFLSVLSPWRCYKGTNTGCL